MRNLAFVIAVGLAPLIACGDTPQQDGRPEPEQPKIADTRGDDGALTLLDRKPADYFTTLVRTSEGRRFTEGRAVLEIVAGREQPQVRLQLEAFDETGQPWRGIFPLDESALIGSDAHLERDAAELLAADHRVSGHLLGATVNDITAATLALSREGLTGKLPALHGHVRSEHGTAEFRSEYALRCLVPPDMVGHTSDVRIDPGYSDVQMLVPDERFESAFCRRFSRLR